MSNYYALFLPEVTWSCDPKCHVLRAGIYKKKQKKVFLGNKKIAFYGFIWKTTS